MIDHNLISSRLEVVYLRACMADFDSPRCRFFRYEVDIL
jgi:predicted metal-binding protein